MWENYIKKSEKCVKTELKSSEKCVDLLFCIVFLISLSAAFLGSALPNDVADSDEGPDEDSNPWKVIDMNPEKVIRWKREKQADDPADPQEGVFFAHQTDDAA